MNHSSHLSGPIVFTGSSIIALWENLPQFFPEVELLNTAISGSQTDEIYVHLDALVVSQSPSLVCYYCGSNDINHAVAVQVIVENVIKTYQAIRDKLGQTTFVFLSIIKAPQKMNRWGVVDEVNMQINQLAHTYPGFAYIDINPIFFTEDGEPRLQFYVADQLHLTLPAYVTLGAYLAPRVMKIMHDWEEDEALLHPQTQPTH